MASAQQISALAAVNCEVAFDNLTRQLYATDASPYQVEPMAVAFPRSTKQAVSIVQAASQAGIPIIPRGAGTGLTGGAVVSSSVDGVSLARATLTELYELRRKYIAEVASDTDNFTTRVVFPSFNGNILET